MSAELLVDQLTTADSINTFSARMLKTAKDKRTVSWLKTNLETLNEYWEEFRERHKKLARLNEEERKEMPYFKEDVYGSIQNSYIQTKSMILSSISPGRNQSSVQADQDYANLISEPPLHRSPLNSIGLPKFYGNDLEWETFKEMFISLVHNVPTMPPILKLQYLLGALTGEAAKRVKNVKVTAANYSITWEKFIRRYDNKRALLSAHMKNIIECPPAAKRSVEEISRILDVMEESIQAITNINEDINNWDPWFVHLTVYKLDTDLREEWDLSLGDSETLPTFKELSNFLENRVRAMKSAHQSERVPTSQETHKGKPTKTARAHTTMTDQDSTKRSPKSCLMCNGQHYLSSCAKYREMTIDKRRTFIVKENLCENCLKPGHVSDSCRSSGRCFVCQGKHHSTLHPAAVPVPSPTQGKTTPGSSLAATSVTCDPPATISAHYVSQPVLLATAIVDLQGPTGDTVTVRALLDQGSEFCFVTERVAQCLRLDRKEVNVSVLGIGEASPGTIRSLVQLTLKSRTDAQFEISIQALVLKSLTALIPSTRLQVTMWKHLEGLTLADPNYGVPGKIDCIIGAEFYCRLLTGQIRRGQDDQPIAQETSLGWVISGSAGPPGLDSQGLHTVGSHHVTWDHKLNETLQRFWRIEELPAKPVIAPEDAYVEEHFSSTYSRAPDGRFIVRLPLKEEPPGLGDSRSIAVTRWLQTERRLEKDAALAKLYHQFMEEYLKLGHMELVSEESPSDSHAVYYLPHHGVLRGHGAARKIRVVFNASQKTSNNKSLNEVLYVGPNLQEELWVIVFRWRLFRLAFTTDTVKMFRQTLHDKRDVDLLRIIWRASRELPLQTYRLLTVTYGTAPAPYLALRVLLELAALYAEK